MNIYFLIDRNRKLFLHCLLKLAFKNACFDSLVVGPFVLICSSMDRNSTECITFCVFLLFVEESVNSVASSNPSFKNHTKS